MLNEISLQIEFKRRQQCNKFSVYVSKNMSGFFSWKAERCVWLKFNSYNTKEIVKNSILKSVPKCELKHRETGTEYTTEYLFVN